MVLGTSRFGIVQKLAICLILTLSAKAALAASGFTPQHRLGYTSGDQWEPALATDAHGHIYILFPQYGKVAQCSACVSPTMVLLTSDDNGVSWGAPQPLLTSTSGQFDAQIKVDPVDRQTLYASWMQGRHDIVVARSEDFGRSWSFATAEHSPELEIDKPVLAVRGPNVYVSFNHEQTLAVAASHDFGQNFSATILNPGAEPGWSLAAGATVDLAGNVYFSWTAYPQTNVFTQPVGVFVSRSADGGRNWSTTPMDVSSAAPACPAEICSAGFLASQMALASDDAELSMPCGTPGRRQVDRNGFTSPLPPMKGKAGQRKLASQTPHPAWNTASQRLRRAPRVTSVSHGWIREKRTRKSIFFGILISEFPPMAGRLGRPNRNSPAPRTDTITSFPTVSSFHLATCFPSVSITSAQPMQRGAKAAIIGRLVRSGTRAGAKLGAN